MTNEREVVLVLLPMITKEAEEPMIVLTPTLTLLLLFLAPNDMPE
jgi:hypothetical protein